jgi:hypothetical protein
MSVSIELICQFVLVMETDGRERTKRVFLKYFSKHTYKHKTLHSNSILAS